MTGESAPDLLVTVPPGTVVKDTMTGNVLIDLVENDQMFCAARGGQGGKGNLCFKSSTNRAPRETTPGEPGEACQIKLELKLLADVGLVGLPNAGKSSLLAMLSSARPKIANYAFTTIEPNLGVVDLSQNEQIVMADIPGLIEGASQGLGLGHEFLRHISRCKMLLHVVDVSELADMPPAEAIDKINQELENYGGDLLGKPKIMIWNKVDLLVDKDVLNQLGEGIPISAVTEFGKKTLLDFLRK